MRCAGAYIGPDQALAPQGRAIKQAGLAADGRRLSTGVAVVPLQVVEPVRLYRQIAGQIATLIDSGEFATGSRLPPERELAVLLGVSRTSVREALISLEIAGRVEVRVGTGIFVRRQPAGAGTASRKGSIAVANGHDEGPGPFELLAARRLIEGEIAALAARSIRKGQIGALRETIERMRTHGGDFEQRDAADRDFHVGIAVATGNGSFPLVVTALWEQRRGELWTRIEEHFHTAALREKTLSDHAAIVTALAAHDSEAARAAMQRHLARVEREFQRKWDTRAPGARARGNARSLSRPRRASAQNP